MRTCENDAENASYKTLALSTALFFITYILAGHLNE